MEWLRNLFSQIKESWAKWSTVQRIILFSIIGVVVLGLVLVAVFSSSPASYPLFTRGIQDETLLAQVTLRLDQENVEYTVNADNVIYLSNQSDALRMRAILTREDLVPAGVDPWELFDIQRWTQTDFERNVNLRRSIIRELEQHIHALNDVDAVSISIVLPEQVLFQEQQNPVTASVIITPKPSSDLRENRSKIEGIEKLILFAVEGLAEENLSITDQYGIVLNDFESLEDFDRLELTKRERALIQTEEEKLEDAIVNSLSGIFSEDRVEMINITVDMDMSRISQETQEIFPIETVPDNPLTPYSEREFVLTVPRSNEIVDEQYEGTGFNPEGPPGLEGQTPPAYKDLEGIIGRWSNSENRINNELNSRTTIEERSPTITRITASVAIDGIWNWIYDEQGIVVVNPDGSIQREYVPVSAEELAKATELVQNAIGYDVNRNDQVSVENIAFDRRVQFADEDEEFRRQQQARLIAIYVAIGLAAMLLSFLVVRLITKEIERRRRLREERLARQYQAMREAALRREQPETGPSFEEEIIALIRERPADSAQLLRTWIMEE